MNWGIISYWGVKRAFNLETLERQEGTGIYRKGKSMSSVVWRP